MQTKTKPRNQQRPAPKKQPIGPREAAARREREEAEERANRPKKE